MSAGRLFSRVWRFPVPRAELGVRVRGCEGEACPSARRGPSFPKLLSLAERRATGRSAPWERPSVAPGKVRVWSQALLRRPADSYPLFPALPGRLALARSGVGWQLTF